MLGEAREKAWALVQLETSTATLSTKLQE